MEGQEYITVNPDLLANDQLWCYRDIQKLCVKLQLGGRGKRCDLIDKLTTWHRNRECECRPTNETFEMNVVGNNFSLLEVKVRPRGGAKNKSKKRKSIIAFENDENAGVISPTFLRPLRRDSCTPGKSILKRKDMNVEEDEERSAFKASRIAFSPFNGVK
eukprot:gene10274-21440_t